MKFLRSKTVFITGATGLLGRHLQRSVAAERFEIVAPGSTALDIRHRDRVLHMVADWKPLAIIHLAYRRDDRRTIVDGSRNMAEAAAAAGARLVHVSTDVVFAGRDAPYIEADAPFPITEYGRMKADAEIAVMAACPSAVMVRTSLMYGTDIIAPPQRDVERAIRGETTMSFFTDEFRCPAHAADVATACATLAAMPEINGPLHIAGPEAISRAEFAAAIARWMGLNPAQLRTTSLAASGLDRPGRLVLDVSRAATLGVRCRPVSEALAST
jgi:dTDP-4-dehydrorhamnose reductase